MSLLLVCIALTTGLINAKDCKDPMWVGASLPFGKCTLKQIGYKPSGREFKLKPVLSPTAILQKNIISGATEKLEKGSNALEQSVNRIAAYTKPSKGVQTTFQKIAKLAPKLASTFGIFGLAFSLMSSEFDNEGPEDILEATNLAFEEMTKRMNEKFDDMVEYIDREIIESDKSWVVTEFRKLQTKWYNCKSRIHDVDDLYSCQKNAVSDIRSDYHFFMKFNTERKNHKNLSVKNVKKLESLLEPFRDYVTFSITSVDALGGSYEIDAIRCIPNAKKYFKTYYEQQVEDIEKFIAYANWAIGQIKRGHTNGDRGVYCVDQTGGGFNCGQVFPLIKDGFFSDTTLSFYYNCSCSFDPTLSKSVTCGATYHIRNHEDAPGYYVKYCAKDGYSAELWARTAVLGNTHNSNYYKEFKTYVEKYWKTQLLMETWETALQHAKDKVAMSEGEMCDRELGTKYKDYNKLAKTSKNNKKEHNKAKTT